RRDHRSAWRPARRPHVRRATPGVGAGRVRRSASRSGGRTCHDACYPVGRPAGRHRGRGHHRPTPHTPDRLRRPYSGKVHDLNTAFTTTTTAPQSVSVRLAGALDYETIDELVDVGSQLLTQQNELSDLHLDFRETTFVDSAALSGLLLLHRRTTQA